MGSINDRIGFILNESKKTKTAFAESLQVSQQYISKLIRTGNPSDLLISDICEKYNVNEDWLRTGEGEPFVKRTRNQLITDFLGDVINEDDESFRKRLVEALAKLDIEDWEYLAKLSTKLAKKD